MQIYKKAHKNTNVPTSVNKSRAIWYEETSLIRSYRRMSIICRHNSPRREAVVIAIREIVVVIIRADNERIINPEALGYVRIITLHSSRNTLKYQLIKLQTAQSGANAVNRQRYVGGLLPLMSTPRRDQFVGQPSGLGGAVLLAGSSRTAIPCPSKLWLWRQSAGKFFSCHFQRWSLLWLTTFCARQNEIWTRPFLLTCLLQTEQTSLYLLLIT